MSIWYGVFRCVIQWCIVCKFYNTVFNAILRKSDDELMAEIEKQKEKAEKKGQPFDVAEAETEICEGPLVEYSGAPLAMFKLNTAIKMFIMTALFTVLFFGGINTGYVALNALILVAICAVLTVITMTLAHAICARLKIEHLFKFYWTFVAALAAISLILVWIF